MAETTSNQMNIDAVVADFKKKSADVVKARTGGGAALGASIGSIIPGVGTAIGSAVGAAVGYISTLFGSKQPWSALDGNDKSNLVDGLALEAIYNKKLLPLALVKSYVYNRLKTEKVLTTTEETEFWQKNDWAQNHVISYLKSYNDTIALINRIADSMKFALGEYEGSKNSAIALTAIYNLKKGKQPTVEEKNAIGLYLQQINAREKSKVGNNIGDIVAGDGRG